MNKHTRKKYPNAVREIIVYENAPKPKGNTVSLFDETVKRVAELEAQLAAEKKHSAALEKALAASRKVNEIAIKKGLNRDYAGSTPRAQAVSRHNINSLSDAETEQLFVSLSVPDDYVDEKAIEAPKMPWRSGVLAPICALFKRGERGA